MKLASITEDRETFKKFRRSLRSLDKTEPNVPSAVSSSGLGQQEWFDFLRRMPKDNAHTSNIAALRKLLPIIKEAPTSVAKKIINLHKQNLSDWDYARSSPNAKEDEIIKQLQDGTRLVGWTRETDLIRSLVESGDIVAIPRATCERIWPIVALPENRDVAEYIASLPIQGIAATVNSGLAFGYPAMRVLEYLRDTWYGKSF